MQCQSCYVEPAEICRTCRDKDLNEYEKEIRKLKKMVAKRDTTIKHIRTTIKNCNKMA